MSTRGFVGKKREGKISGYYNHSDSYYDYLGKAVVDAYFNKRNIYETIDNDNDDDDNNEFITDGLYCEYGYVYDEDTDRLEVYRGSFKTPQWTDEGLDSSGIKWYTHLIFIVDRKIHNKKLVLKAFGRYNDSNSDTYPEREIIPLNKEDSNKLNKLTLCNNLEV